MPCAALAGRSWSGAWRQVSTPVAASIWNSAASAPQAIAYVTVPVEAATTVVTARVFSMVLATAAVSPPLLVISAEAIATPPGSTMRPFATLSLSKAPPSVSSKVILVLLSAPLPTMPTDLAILTHLPLLSCL